MTRVWIVNHYGLPPGSSGGPRRHLGLSRSLVARGHEVTVVASSFDHYTRQRRRELGTEPWVVEDIDGVQFVWMRSRPYSTSIGRIRDMCTFSAAVVRNLPKVGLTAPEVIVGSSPHLPAAWAAHRVARRLRVPFVLEVRDLWPQSLIDLGRMSPRHPAMVAMAAMERSLYRSADHIVVVPPLAGNYIVERGGERGRVTVIPNGADLDTPAGDTVRTSSASGFVVVYVGTMGNANGLEIVVDAARVIRERGRDDVRIRLIGPGPQREALADLNERAGSPLLSVEQEIPASEVPKVLAAADAALMVLRDSPVFRWGISPTKLFEYLAAARPVVFCVNTPVNIVDEAGAGVTVRSHDGEGLADAILELAATPPAVRAEMGRRGRDAMAGRHTFDVLAQQMESVLQQAVGHARSKDGRT